MTREEAYKYLSRPRQTQLKILQKLALIHGYKTCLLPAGIRYDKDKVQTAPTDQMSEVMAKIDGLRREITELKQLRIAQIEETQNMILSLENETEKTVLYMYFIEQKPMENISDSVGYSRQHTYRIRNDGLDHIGAKNVTNENLRRDIV